MVQQQQILGNRLATLAMLAAGSVDGDSAAAMHRFARAALAVGCTAPASSWNQWDFAGLMQAEAQRGMTIARGLKQWHDKWGEGRTPERAFALLAEALGAQAQGASVSLPSPEPLTTLLTCAANQLPTAADTAWLAWLLWWNAPVSLTFAEGRWTVQAVNAGSPEPVTSPDWLERMIEQLLER